MTDQVDRTVLPIRRPPFAGVANQTLGGSQPDWGLIGHVKPPAGAPNVLLVFIDDAGFGNPSTFGGPIDTPHYDRIPEFSGAFPGYSAMLPSDAAPFPKVLKENGYSTAGIGKWHLTPEREQGPAGPFNHWPNAWGFERYLGVKIPPTNLQDHHLEEARKFADGLASRLLVSVGEPR
jgi:arylsulfatase